MRGNRGGTQAGNTATGGSGGVRGPFSNNNNSGANRRGAITAAADTSAQMGNKGNNRGATGGGVGGGANNRRGAVGGHVADTARGRVAETAARGAIRGRTLGAFQSAPRVSSLGDGADVGRRGASMGRAGAGGTQGRVNHGHGIESSRSMPTRREQHTAVGGAQRSRSRPDARGGNMTRYGAAVGDARGMHQVGGYDRRSMHVDDDVSYRGRGAVDTGRESGRTHAPGAYGSSYRSNNRDMGRRTHAEDAYGMRDQVDLLDQRPMAMSSRQDAGRADYATNVNNQQKAYTVVPAGAQQPPPGVQYTEARLPDGQIIQVMIPTPAQDNIETDSRIYQSSSRYQVAQEPTYVTQVVQQQQKQTVQSGRGLYTSSVQDAGVTMGGYTYEGGRREYEEPVGHALDADGRAAMMAYAGAGNMVYDVEPSVQRTVSGQQYTVQVRETLLISNATTRGSW